MNASSAATATSVGSAMWSSGLVGQAAERGAVQFTIEP
jgi:hypothetical protein